MTGQLLHLTEEPLWEAARRAGTYEMSTRGRTLREEGFIHCSLPHQLPAVVRALYGTDDQGLVVLVIDEDLLPAPVRYEALRPGGEEFPHIYGPLPTSAVVEVRPWSGAAAREEGEAR
ncbi:MULTISPECIES: DUF952 domain-containing protein [unclassified Streptomyces]|uniref:DUF952 domain-containing protein n=1 Tax=unclassified Streptomyces TaxID=2593676 RepID=UPI00093C555C|nr:DUF952 domain-containing protein [Streptomyces sp. CB02058]OKI98147.1 glutathione S-transferase [Streptomyces sp. CB02058]